MIELSQKHNVQEHCPELPAERVFRFCPPVWQCVDGIRTIEIPVDMERDKSILHPSIKGGNYEK
jgi:hypothetical protein